MDLSQMEKIVESIPQSKTGMQMELTAVKISWGAGVTQDGRVIYALQITNHDETWTVRIPMEEPYLNAKLRELEQIKAQMNEAVEQVKANAPAG